MHDEAVHRLSVESDLDRAIANEEFLLHYQPIVHPETEAITGVEALVRWAHPTRGLLPPGDFIPLAEETGKIVQSGRWVRREVGRKAEEWEHDRAPGHPLSVSFNVSAVQLQRPNLASELGAAIRETGIDPDCIVVELTESILMLDTENATERLRQFHSPGAPRRTAAAGT